MVLNKGQRNLLVSVVIPTYNRAYSLKRAIESVSNQTYKNLEIIIVDDGSIDNTEEIVSYFKDPRIQYLHHLQNRGPSSARNTGIKNSKGDLIALLDSDDEYFPQKIEKSVEVFMNCSSRIGIVSSNHYIIREGKKKLGIEKFSPKRRLFPLPSTWVIRRKVIEKIGLFDERILVGEDIDFFCRVRRKFSFYFIEQPLVIKYPSQDNIFSSIENVISIREKYLPSLRSERRLYARHLNYLGKDYFYIGKIKEAR
ncbi:MAG: glycosyltransferase family 2 protein, partial [Candidatus Omnitrophica bacterium]|nr:glycosyltransferase family 2 protein [Candidatus Omnitrophota bacterium]